MMRFKSVITGLLLISLLVTSAFGCGSPGKDTNKPEVPMGRYVEEIIDMPEAIQSGSEVICRVSKSPEGLIELCCGLGDGSGNTQYTLTSNNTWEKAIPKWLNKENMYLNNITYAPDGTKYAILVSYNSDDTETIRFYKSSDNDNAEEIVLEGYEEDVSMDKEPSNISVLEDNTILLSFINGDKDPRGNYIIYRNGKKVAAFKTGSYKYALYGNKLLTVNENQDECIIIDATTGNTLSNIPVTSYNYRNQFAADKEGNWYLVSDLGVQRMITGGSTWETIMNGSQTFMSKMSQRVEAMYWGNNDDFYITYSTSEGERTLMHYVYNKNISTTPSTTLSVVALYSNDTIREAISDFNRENPDVLVEYREFITDGSGGTETDFIKKINTDLLAGKGADILVLDGLPVKSYTEKNILADLSDTISPMIENGELLNTIMNNYKNEDGSIYTIPLRFTTFFTYGDKEAVASTKSINALADYAKTAKLPLLGSEVLSYSDLCTLLYPLYSDSFLKENSIKREELMNFLQQLKVISDQIKALPERTIGTESGDYLRRVYSKLIYEKKALLGIHDIWGMSDTYQPLLVTDKTGGTCSIVNKTFIPQEMLGVNNASTHKEVAYKFIKTLLSKDIQKVELYDGFPVNAAAMDIFGMDSLYVQGLEEGAEYIPMDKEKAQSIHELLKTVDTPVATDWTLLTIVNKEAAGYLNGTSTLEATTDKIITNANSYLTEQMKE